MTPDYTDFIFAKFHEDNIAADDGLRHLIEALCKALVHCSAREDLDKNIAKACAAIRCATPLYYEEVRILLENEEV